MSCMYLMNCSSALHRVVSCGNRCAVEHYTCMHILPHYYMFCICVHNLLDLAFVQPFDFQCLSNIANSHCLIERQLEDIRLCQIERFPSHCSPCSSSQPLQLSPPPHTHMNKYICKVQAFSGTCWQLALYSSSNPCFMAEFALCLHISLQLDLNSRPEMWLQICSDCGSLECIHLLEWPHIPASLWFKGTMPVSADFHLLPLLHLVRCEFPALLVDVPLHLRHSHWTVFPASLLASTCFC